jgi:hypothetical protein
VRFLLLLIAILCAASTLDASAKPKLSLSVAPTHGSPSTLFVFRALLKGVQDTEDFYCLSTEWVWEEQADSSLNEAECPPFVQGETRVDRSFVEEQSFRRPGPHRVRVVLRKGEKEIASASITVIVRDMQSSQQESP